MTTNKISYSDFIWWGAILICVGAMAGACSGKPTSATPVCDSELGTNWWGGYASGGVQSATNIDPDRCAPVDNVFCCITHD